jgi:hypothetical protein
MDPNFRSGIRPDDSHLQLVEEYAMLFLFVDVAPVGGRLLQGAVVVVVAGADFRKPFWQNFKDGT